PPPPRVSLSKVTLDKKGDKKIVDLRKGGAGNKLHFNLNWTAPAARKKGFLAGLAGGASAPDLDLGCMFEMADGKLGVIQPLGGNFGNQNGPPHIYLDKDDRSGSAADGENLYILRPDLIKRVMVFALIYEGAKDFTSVGGRLTVTDPDGNEILVQLNNPDANHPFCSICLVTQSGGGVAIQKEERYFRGHRDADQYYQFGFSWSAGSK
ncbi:MAG: TerD family protein, partial [Acidimicrobiales bacterium]